jgi:hypothetical protein
MTVRIPRWLLTQEATFRSYQGQNAWGNAYGTDLVDFPCRMEPTNTLVMSREGSELLASAILYTEPDVQLKPSDEVIIDGEPYNVVKVDRLYNLAGRVHHLEVMLS